MTQEDEKFIQDKQMEKEQIIDAFVDGYTYWDSELTGEEYYNETYNK